MLKKIGLLALAAILAVATWARPADAQFVDQATYAVGGGAANVQTLALPNVGAQADLLGVAFKYLPGFNNTGSATLNVTGTGASAIKKITSAGLLALCGGELNSTQVAIVLWDGTQYELLNPAVKAPTYQHLTSGTSATYTTPACATGIDVVEIGGGGGGGGGGISASSGGNGGTGGNTLFNAIAANGGSGGTGAGSAYGFGAAGGSGGSGSALSRIAGGSGSGGTPISAGVAAGGLGGASCLGGAGTSTNGAGVGGATNSGSGGGGGASATASSFGGGGGGSGECVHLTPISAPSATYTYSVGTAGSAGTAGTGSAGGAGGSGDILVREYYN